MNILNEVVRMCDLLEPFGIDKREIKFISSAELEAKIPQGNISEITCIDEKFEKTYFDLICCDNSILKKIEIKNCVFRRNTIGGKSRFNNCIFDNCDIENCFLDGEVVGDLNSIPFPMKR